jgi:hypothetical protein
VVLELCQPRIQAMLVDPYRDPLHDLEPCPDKMAAAAQTKQRSVPEILSAAFKSRDHNVLSAMMGVSALRGSIAVVLRTHELSGVHSSGRQASRGCLSQRAVFSAA